MAKTIVRGYASSSCVLLAFDWPDGKNHPNFLGFAIERAPGYTKSGEPQFLFNKIDFQPIDGNSKPKGSDKAPIQKFNWWDGGINLDDRGKSFTYTVTPVLGTGANDLALQHSEAGTLKVTVPEAREGDVESHFNRAVVSSQSFQKKAKSSSLEQQMDWLANGLQEAVPGILKSSAGFDCAIYHLTDERWIIPALAKYKQRGSLIYFDKNDDHASKKGLTKFTNAKITRHKRTKISALMHDKFIVSYKAGKPDAVLMGSTNFTPEAQTVQANVLHVLHSPQLAKLYAARARLLESDPTTAVTAKGAGWTKITDVAGTKLRVFFLPEPSKGRVFLDTVVDAVKKAKSSVLFCMFTASDGPLMEAIFAVGDDKNRLIYGLLNSIDDPTKRTKKGEKRNLPPIAVKIYNRSRAKPDTLSYDRFTKDNAPAGFLPELYTIDTSKYSGGANPPVAVHVHHKFIVIDGDTSHPIIFTGSPNFSKASENSNDENVLEIKDNVPLAQAYVAEFLRLYGHYRARAIWDATHAKKGAAKKAPAKKKTGEADALVLKTTRDEWVKYAYQTGTKTYLARTRFL